MKRKQHPRNGPSRGRISHYSRRSDRRPHPGSRQHTTGTWARDTADPCRLGDIRDDPSQLSKCRDELGHLACIASGSPWAGSGGGPQAGRGLGFDAVWNYCAGGARCVLSRLLSGSRCLVWGGCGPGSGPSLPCDKGMMLKWPYGWHPGCPGCPGGFEVACRGSVALERVGGIGGTGGA